MEYQREDEPKVRFTVPDRPSVRQQLQYLGAGVSAGGSDFFLSLWRGALVLVDEWECEIIPNPRKLDLNKADDLKITEVVTWVGMRVREFVNSLDNVPKN